VPWGGCRPPRFSTACKPRSKKYPYECGASSKVAVLRLEAIWCNSLPFSPQVVGSIRPKGTALVGVLSPRSTAPFNPFPTKISYPPRAAGGTSGAGPPAGRGAESLPYQLSPTPPPAPHTTPTHLPPLPTGTKYFAKYPTHPPCQPALPSSHLKPARLPPQKTALLDFPLLPQSYHLKNFPNN